MSGTKRGQQLYMTMANGNAVPSEIVTDLLGEAMVAKADSKVILNLNRCPIYPLVCYFNPRRSIMAYGVLR